MSSLAVPDGWTWRVVRPDGSTERFSTADIRLSMAGELRQALGLDPEPEGGLGDDGTGLMVIRAVDPAARTYEVFIK